MAGWQGEGKAVWHEQKALGWKRQRDFDGEGGCLLAEVAKRIDTRLVVIVTRPGQSECE